MNKIFRTGDWSFHQIKELPNKITKIVNKTESFIYGIGEASNHTHIITSEDLDIFQDENGRYYFDVKKDGLLTHENMGGVKIGQFVKSNPNDVADHKPVIIKKGIYKAIQEREVDIFSQVIRKVKD